MALSDCFKCWSTPCECGYEYRYRSEQNFAEFIVGILAYKSKDEEVRILKSAIQ